MRTKHLNNIPPCRSHAYPCASHALPYEPVPAIKGCWTPIERVLVHTALLYRPSAQDNQTSPKYAAMVELPIGQKMPGPFSYSIIIFLRPALLQAHNIRKRIRGSNLVSDFREALVAELGNELEAPTIQGQDAELRWRWSRRSFRRRDHDWRLAHSGHVKCKGSIFGAKCKMQQASSVVHAPGRLTARAPCVRDRRVWAAE
jgi:hypothetical protein